MEVGEKDEPRAERKRERGRESKKKRDKEERYMDVKQKHILTQDRIKHCRTEFTTLMLCQP